MKNGKLGFDPPDMGRDKDDYIPDPAYVGPAWPDNSTNPELFYKPRSQGEVDCDDVDPLPASIQARIDDGEDVVCYSPGVYEEGNGQERDFKVDSGQYVYLMPGAYLFEGGLDVNGHLFGGLIDNEQGVVLSVPNDKEMDLESAESIVLNVGTDSCGDDTCSATAALDFDGNPVTTADPNDPGQDVLPITFYVPRDPSCFSGRTPIESKDCSADENSTVKLSGTSALQIRGVIYAPSERIAIRGNSSSDAIDGQIVGWTLEWSGGSTLNLNYPDFEQLGVLRLDAACTGLAACNP